MKNLENEKKVIFFITIVWAIISLAGGIIFLKKILFSWNDESMVLSCR